MAEPQPTDSFPVDGPSPRDTEIAVTDVAGEPDAATPEASPPPAPDLEQSVVRYRWTVSVLVSLEAGQPRTELVEPISIDVDRERQVALLEFDDSVLPESSRGDQAASPVFVAYVDDAQLTLGFDGPQLGWVGDGKPDPATWYLGEQVGEPGLPDILPANADTASLLESLGMNNDDSGRVAMSAQQVRTLGIDGQHLFAALARSSLDVDGPLSLTIDSDDAGRISHILIEREGDDDSEDDTMTIAIYYDIDPFDVPAYESAKPVPGWPGTDSTTASLDAIDEALSGSFDVALRLNVYLARDLNVVLTPENVLVRVGQTDISAGPDDFEQWQLTRAGAERLLVAVLENPVVASGDYNTYHPYGVGLDIGSPPSELNANPSRDQGVTNYRGDIEALIDLLDDPSWLGDDIMSGPEPWVPDTLTLTARSADRRGDAVAWPLSAGIRELGSPGVDRLEEAIVVCLTGEDVAPIWALLGGGTNYAHIDLDDGETWDAGVMLNWPGYRLISDPCGPDYERYLEVTGASGD